MLLVENQANVMLKPPADDHPMITSTQQRDVHRTSAWMVASPMTTC